MYVSVTHVFLVPKEAEEGAGFSGSFRWLWGATWVLGIKPGSPLEDPQELLTAEPSLQPPQWLLCI